MPRLIEWFPAVIDPGASSQSTVDDRREVWVSKAAFDVPVDFDFIYNLQECPKFFQPLPTNDYLFVVDIEIKQIQDAPQCYEIRITYSNKWRDTQNGKPDFQFILDPTQRPALITGSKYTLREGVEFADRYEVTTDNRGRLSIVEVQKNALVGTSAGEPLVMEEEYHRRMFTITKNVKTLTDLMVKGGDYINEDVVVYNGTNIKFPKGTLWLWPIDYGNITVENGFYYYPLTITILHNPKGWMRKIRNAGYYMTSPNIKFKPRPNGGFDKYRPMIPIRYSNGTKPDRPVLLKEIVVDRNLQSSTKITVPLQYVETGRVPAADGLNINGVVPQPGFPPRDEIAFDVQSPEDFGRAFTQEELDQATRHYKTFEWLRFNENVPLN